MVRRSATTGHRKGAIALAALIALPVVLLAFVVGLSARTYRDIHTRLQAEADASALAGADSLAGDAMLRGRLQSGANAAELFSLLDYSRLQVRAYAQANPVFGDYSKPDWNLTDPTAGDIIFGAYDSLASTKFTPVAPQDSMGAPATNLQTVNAVKVFIRRNEAQNNQVPVPKMPLIGSGKVDASAVSSAMLDGDLQGFRPMFTDRPVPLIPVALDYTAVATQTSVPFADTLAYDATTGTFVGGSDQLPEITVNLTITPPPSGVSTTAAVLHVGHLVASEIATQITTGITAADLAGAPFGGAFLLQPDTSTMPPRLVLAVPGEQYFTSADGPTFDAALDVVAATPSKPRLWPVYDGVDGTGQPIIVGFLAARLISSQTSTDGMGATTAIELKLQPTLVTDPSAVTNAAYRGYRGVPNLTIAKLRLVP